MKLYQIITFSGLIINLHADSISNAIADAKSNGYKIVSITQVAVK